MVLGYKLAIPPAICKFFWTVTIYAIATGWLAQAIVAMTRAILLIKREWLKQYGKTKNILIFFAAVWLYQIILFIPYLREVGIGCSKHININVARK